MMTHLYMQIPVPVRACASTRADPNTHTGMSITGNANLRVLVPTYICLLPNWQISVTGNAPYDTGIGIRTSAVRCPSWYCPNFCFINHRHLFSYQFTLCTFDEPWNSTHYRYGNIADYRTGNAIVTLWMITHTVIGQVTVPVMQSWCFKELLVG